MVKEMKPPKTITKTDGNGNKIAVPNPAYHKRGLPTNITPPKKKRK